MNRRELKKHMLYDMASTYMQGVLSKLEIMSFVYDIEIEELTEAKIKRFEEIRKSRIQRARGLK